MNIRVQCLKSFLYRRLEQWANIHINPRSENPDAITLAPRSCLSWPILSTKIRGRVPSVTAKISSSLRTVSFSLSLLFPEVNAAWYAPWTTFVVGMCRWYFTECTPHFGSLNSEFHQIVWIVTSASTSDHSCTCFQILQYILSCNLITTILHFSYSGNLFTLSSRVFDL